jgi:hypothetical protein
MKLTSSEGEHLPCTIFSEHVGEISHNLHDHLCKVVTGLTFLHMLQGSHCGFFAELILIVYGDAAPSAVVNRCHFICAN